LSIHSWRTQPLRRLLLVAALLHIALAITIAVVGKARLLPNTFDTNGVGVAFALDSVSYREQALYMASLLREGRVRDWINYRAKLATFHARVYSISYALLGWVLGEGVLAIEPVNLFYYLTMIVLTYLVGASAFSAIIGRLAAIAIGLWPSLLMFTTQLLRDPMYVCCFLLLVWILIICIKGLSSWREVGIYTAAGFAALSLVLLARAAMWEIVLLTVLLAAGACFLSQARARRLDLQTSVAVLLLCVAVFLLPKVMSGGRVVDRYEQALARNPALQATPNNGLPWSKLATQIGWARHVFIVGYPGSGSNLDSHVELQTAGDIVRYLPRALQLGLLAPFPSMWFAPGAKVGLSGRLIIGAEMLALYGMLFLSVITVVRERRRLLVWFLFAMSVLACTILALVVVNAGALYRLRYPYFIPIIFLSLCELERLITNRRLLLQKSAIS
jgi:hypothetical protein